VTRIELQDFVMYHQGGRVLLYDARTAFFHSLGHIPGSRNWPKSAYDAQLKSREAEIRSAKAAGKIVVIYCSDTICPDARAVADRLALRGHDVCVLDGGWEAWKRAGLPQG